jgi:hypothetical protein
MARVSDSTMTCVVDDSMASDDSRKSKKCIHFCPPN